MDNAQLEKLTLHEDKIAEYNASRNPRKYIPRTPNTMKAMLTTYGPNDEIPYDEEVIKAVSAPAALPLKKTKAQVPSNVAKVKPIRSSKTVQKTTKTQQQHPAKRVKFQASAKQPPNPTRPSMTASNLSWDEKFKQAIFLSSISSRNDWSPVTIALNHMVQNIAPKRHFSMREMQKRTNEAFTLFHKRILANCGIVKSRILYATLKALYVPDTDVHRAKMTEVLETVDRLSLQRLVTPLVKE